MGMSTLAIVIFSCLLETRTAGISTRCPSETDSRPPLLVPIHIHNDALVLVVDSNFAHCFAFFGQPPLPEGVFESGTFFLEVIREGHQSSQVLVTIFTVALFTHFPLDRFQEGLRSRRSEKLLALRTPNEASDGFDIQLDVSSTGRTVGTVHSAPPRQGKSEEVKNRSQGRRAFGSTWPPSFPA